MGMLRLFVDRMSQPSRAIIIFCLANGITADIQNVSLLRGEHRKPQFKSINPMGLVPAIDHDGFQLFESHAILRYLSNAFPSVKDHWYPSDIRKRAQIDCVLDWHHANLRRGAAGLVMNSVIAPALGRPLDVDAASKAEAQLKQSLELLEIIWLKGDEPFLTGNLEPSIADLSLACEVTQLQLLGKEKESQILDQRPKVSKWLNAVEEAISPHFFEVHDTLQKAADFYQKKREREHVSPTDGTNIRSKI